MPLVRISLNQKKSIADIEIISEAIHTAMVETIGIPKDDRFQVITAHPDEELIYDPHYLGISRSDNVVFIQITLNQGRSVQQKRDLYARTVEKLVAGDRFRPQDVLINLVEVPKENWSFGDGEAQYA